MWKQIYTKMLEVRETKVLERLLMRPSVRKLKDLCSQWKEEPTTFSEIVRITTELNIASADDLARHFEISKPTVRRWISGIAVPAIFVQAHVVSTINDLIEEDV